MTKMVISTCYCIPSLRLILAFRHRAFISSSVLFLSVERPVRLFITSSVSQFQAPLGPLGLPCPKTLTTGTWVSFSSLPFGCLRIHLSSEPWQQLTSCVTCSLRRVILLVSPSRSPPLLGFVCDSVRQTLIIPQDKRNKFTTLRKDSLSSPFVSLKLLKRFSGKVISFSLAIPGSKLYVREVFKAVSRHSGSSRPTVKLEANLRADIEYWRFLDDWKDYFRWKNLASRVRYALFRYFKDGLGAELYAWAVTLWSPGITTWTIPSILNVLEAQPLLHSLLSFREHLTSSGVDLHTDSRVLKSALENGGCRSSEVSGILEDFFIPAGRTSALMFTMFRRVKIQPISLPEADQIRIACCQIAPWSKSNAFSGPTRSDLMSLDSNCQRNRVGLHLPHFTSCATPDLAVSTSSLILFLWITISTCSRHLSLSPPLLRYLFEQDFQGAFTIVVPDLKPRRFLVGVAAVTRCRSRSIGKEERRFHFVVPFSGRSSMVPEELAVGRMGLPLCSLNLPVYILLGGPVHGSPLLFCLPLLLPGLWYFNKTSTFCRARSSSWRNCDPGAFR